MIYKLVKADHNEFAPPAGVTEYDTHHNHMPGPYHEISWHEYEHRANIWSPRWREFRQVRGLPGYGERAITGVTIEWYWFGGLAKVPPSRWTIAREAHVERDPLVQLGQTLYQDPARYFYVGCPHKWRRMTDEELAARNWHRLDRHDQIEVCVDCGMPHRYDTSG